MVTLVAGPEKSSILCHKILLRYYSSCCDEAISGTKDVDVSVFDFPQHSKEEMSAFVSWMYSGRLERKPDQHMPCLLWILGKTLGAPLFSNDALRLLSDVIRGFSLEASTVKIAYSNTSMTAANSNLRLFIAALIKREGPFGGDLTDSWSRERSEEYKAEWRNLLMEDGEFRTDVLTHSLGTQHNGRESWGLKNLPKYLEAEPKRSPASWVRAKTSSNLEGEEAMQNWQPTEEQRGLKRQREEEDQAENKRHKHSKLQTRPKKIDSKAQTPTPSKASSPGRNFIGHASLDGNDIPLRLRQCG
jgi:hypothetical protein